MENIEYNGGLFHPKMSSRRAQARCLFDDMQLTFETEQGTFTLNYEEVHLRIGGSSGKMFFLENETKDICFFSEHKDFILQLQQSELQPQFQICMQEHRKNQGFSTLLWGSIIGFICLFIYGCYLALPQIAVASLDVIPISVDEQIGKLSASQMDHGGVEIHDSTIVEPIQNMVQRLSQAAQPDDLESKFDFDVHIIQSDIKNAYALPGGYIVLYTGLIESSTSSEQIAGVLAHEMAHVTQRHGLIKVMETAGVSSLVTLLIGDVEGIISLGAQLLSYSTVNAYSRESETEADEVGLQTMYKANLNPQGMIDFFAELDQTEDLETDLSKSIPTWMQSHPKHKERIAHLQRLLEKFPVKDYNQPLEIDFPTLQETIKKK